MLYVASLVDPSTIASGGGPSGYAVVGLFLGGGGGLGNARGSSEDHLLEKRRRQHNNVDIGNINLWNLPGDTSSPNVPTKSV